MKKLFAIAILGSVVLVSCKKSSGGGGPLQATINGTVTNFATGATGLTASAGGQYTIEVAGASGTTSPNAFEITLQSANPIAVGTYTDTSSTNNAILEYVPYSTGTFFLSAGQASHPSKVVITSVSSTQIAGTFQGTLYANQDTTTTPETITNGTFNVKLTAQ